MLIYHQHVLCKLVVTEHELKTAAHNDREFKTPAHNSLHWTTRVDVDVVLTVLPVNQKEAFHCYNALHAHKRISHSVYVFYHVKHSLKIEYNVDTYYHFCEALYETIRHLFCDYPTSVYLE